MTPFILVCCVLLMRTLLEACSETRKPGHDFLALMAAGVLPLSKKAGARTPKAKNNRKGRR